MLQTAFLTVAGYSLQAAVVILVVIPVRFLLRKLGAPTVVSYALWAVVLFRLLCPVSIESSVGVIPEEIADVPQEHAVVDYQHVPMDTAILAPYLSLGDAMGGSVDGVDFTYKSETAGPNQDGSGRIFPMEALLLTLGVLWPVGIAALVIYSVIAWLRLRRKLVGAVPLEGNIRLADRISSPFVMGVFRPKIYLPSSLSETEREYIILHERNHIRRLDHVVKILAFAALCIHWFNPLVWLAFCLSGKDMEMSCDEAVVKKLGEGIRADYSASLLKLSTGRTVIAATPLAFGEGDTKGRIKNLAKWKKPAVWITVVAVLLCVAVIVLCATNAKGPADNTDIPQQAGQPEPPPRQFGPDQTYVPERCLYMSPFSSFLALGGDSGYRYQMGDGGFYMIRQDPGTAIPPSEAKIPLAEGNGWAKWEMFPWTDKEWETLFWPEGMWKLDISGYGKRQYCALSQGYCLLRMDGELWLADIKEDDKIGTHVWSIYQLVPQSTKGVVQWEFAPTLSSRQPYFRFEFDMEYDEISANCTERLLVDLDGFEHPAGEPGIYSPESDYALRFPAGHAVYWCPWDANRANATQATISFAVNKDEQTVCFCTVYISGHRVEESGNWIYTATLVGTGLVMEQNPDGGAVIRVK